jgi:hypothetical protein
VDGLRQTFGASAHPQSQGAAHSRAPPEPPGRRPYGPTATWRLRRLHPAQPPLIEGRGPHAPVGSSDPRNTLDSKELRGSCIHRG